MQAVHKKSILRMMVEQKYLPLQEPYPGTGVHECKDWAECVFY